MGWEGGAEFRWVLGVGQELGLGDHSPGRAEDMGMVGPMPGIRMRRSNQSGIVEN